MGVRPGPVPTRCPGPAAASFRGPGPPRALRGATVTPGTGPGPSEPALCPVPQTRPGARRRRGPGGPGQRPMEGAPFPPGGPGAVEAPLRAEEEAESRARAGPGAAARLACRRSRTPGPQDPGRAGGPGRQRRGTFPSRGPGGAQPRLPPSETDRAPLTCRTVRHKFVFLIFLHILLMRWNSFTVKCADIKCITSRSFRATYPPINDTP